MNLETVEIPRAGARESAADYTRLAKRTTDPDRRREYEDIARAYRAAARDDVALIALTRTVAAGGTMIRTHVWDGWRGSDRVERRENYLVPRLAVCTPQSAFCFTLGVQADGSVEFIDSLGRDYRYRKGVVSVEAGFDPPPAGFARGESLTGSWWTRGAWRSMVPIVPPQHRPARDRFGSRVVLWEADDWTWNTVPRPPGDPALLRPVGGDIYAVEATWDLTEVEKLVLSGRRL